MCCFLFFFKKINSTSVSRDDHDLRVAAAAFSVYCLTFPNECSFRSSCCSSISVGFDGASALLMLFPLHDFVPSSSISCCSALVVLVSVVLLLLQEFLIFGDFHFCCSMCFLSSSRQTTRLSVRFAAINPDLIVLICQAPNGTDFGHQFVWNAEVP